MGTIAWIDSIVFMVADSTPPDTVSDSNLMPKLLLGAASFGSRYGIANTSFASESEVKEIVLEAKKLGIQGFDTAPAYGDSEQLLGTADLRGFLLYSKISGFASPVAFRANVQSVRDSVSRLGVDMLEGVTFHSSEAFLRNPKESLETIEFLTDEGLIRSWGVSVYEVDELHRVLDAAQPHYIQCPTNVLDQRFLSEAVLARVRERDVALQARSLFLQGLLLTNPHDLPPRFKAWKREVILVHDYAKTHGLSVIELCILSIGGRAEVSQTVVGVNSLKQVNELGSLNTNTVAFDDLAHLASDDEMLIDPRRWK